jgi:hypothetical protein
LSIIIIYTVLINLINKFIDVSLFSLFDVKMKRKSEQLTLGDKVEILKMIEGGSAYRLISEKFGVCKGTISDIKKKKDHLLSAISEHSNLEVKRLKPMHGDHAELDKRVWEWFLQARGRRIPVSGPLLKTKAKIAADALGITAFSASNGWLEKFSVRHDIRMRSLSGESADVEQDIVTSWTVQVRHLLSTYELKDIFNCDETGLFWRASPRKTLTVSTEQSNGHKIAKERLTILLTVSALGEKLTPLVIGKSKKPRGFPKNGAPRGIIWRNNKKAWMQSELFCEYLRNLNDKMECEGRKIALLLDNAPVHAYRCLLSNIELVFLPSNTTSGTQPLDVGIIKNFKVHYQRQLAEHLTLLLDTPQEITYADWIRDISVAIAVNWIRMSWNDVKKETIINCFRRCGLHDKEASISVAIATIPTTVTVDADEHALLDLLQTVGVNRIHNIDENLPVFDELPTDSNWEDVTLLGLIEEDDAEVEETEEEEISQPITFRGALEAWNMVKKYFVEEYEEDIFQELDYFDKKLSEIRSAKRVQKPISAFFAPIAK